jgi:protein tyrosine/serine phosphatase
MKRISFALAVLVLPACESAEEKRTATTTGKPFAARVEGKAGLQNLAQPAPEVYRGAEPTEEGFKTLQSMGVKTIVGFRSHHSTKKTVEAAGLASVELPIQADVFGSEPPTEEQIKVFFATVLDPAKRPVFFHCLHGKDRTGTMAALYRIEVDGWTPAEAIEEMQHFGYHDNYKDLVEFVRKYEPRGYAKKRP